MGYRMAYLCRIVEREVVEVIFQREEHRVGGPKAKENQVGVVQVWWEQGRPGGLPE